MFMMQHQLDTYWVGCFAYLGKVNLSKLYFGMSVEQSIELHISLTYFPHKTLR